MAALAATSNPERADPDLQRHQPHQTPGEGFLQRFAREVLLFRRMERYHPARMADDTRNRRERKMPLTGHADAPLDSKPGG
jgi:hypothetical protein